MSARFLISDHISILCFHFFVFLTELIIKCKLIALKTWNSKLKTTEQFSILGLFLSPFMFEIQSVCYIQIGTTKVLTKCR